MKAYEMIGQQYFYLRNLDKAGYYIERFKRGYFELPCSKIRELSKLQYTQKQENRDCQKLYIPPAKTEELNREM